MNAKKLSLLVVINPNASRSEEALTKLTEWFAENTNAILMIAHKKKDLKALLKTHGPEADRIVIGGGDGTLSKALPALLKLKKPLAVLPLGTANDFARTLGLPDDPLKAAEIALGGREHKIDVGLANGRPYLNVASVGVASEVIKRQSKTLKQTWRVFAYAISLMQAMRRLQPFFVDLEIDDAPRWSAAVYQVSVGNGRYHGGGLTVAEDAAIDDGKLDLYVVHPGTFWQLFACLTHLRFGLMKKPKVLDRHTAVKVKLTTPRPRAVDADGRLATKTPAEFTLKHKALKVVVPRKQPKNHRGLVRRARDQPREVTCADGMTITQRTPLGGKDRSTSPSSACPTTFSIIALPKPERCGGLTSGPPRSCQISFNLEASSQNCHLMLTCPRGSESDPYFVALVASSCSASPRFCTASGFNITSSPSMAICSPKRSACSPNCCSTSMRNDAPCQLSAIRRSCEQPMATSRALNRSRKSSTERVREAVCRAMA